MRYMPDKPNVYVYLDDVDEINHGSNVRFASYETKIIPEKGEVITGPFGYHGAVVAAEVVSCEPGGQPLGICYDVHLRQLEDGKCKFCRSENEKHNKLEGKYLCPLAVQEAAMEKFGAS